MDKTPYLQQAMPGEHVCFGCGTDNPNGLQIESRWEGDECICHWESAPQYNGWPGLMNGGILATIIDCHCMSTAMGAAYRDEGREVGTEPRYGYATGTLTVRYLKPTPNDQRITLRAQVKEIKGRKTTMTCQVWAGGIQTAEAEVIALRVIDTSQPDQQQFTS
ncbi:MAG: PaaI family thioesterase [Bernardetiaceae bacterium]